MPACSSAQAARGGTSRVTIFTGPPAASAGRGRAEPAPASAAASAPAAADDQVRAPALAAQGDAHGAAPRPASASRRAQSRRVELLPGRGPGRASRRAGPASRRYGVTCRPAGVPRGAPAGSAPVPLTQKELTGSRPPRCARVVQRHGCRAASAFPAAGGAAARRRRRAGIQAVDRAADHAVERGAWAGCGTARRAPASAAGASYASAMPSSREVGLHGGQQRLRVVGVELQVLRVRHGDVVACPPASGTGVIQAQPPSPASRPACRACQGRQAGCRPSAGARPQARASARSCGGRQAVARRRRPCRPRASAAQQPLQVRQAQAGQRLRGAPGAAQAAKGTSKWTPSDTAVLSGMPQSPADGKPPLTGRNGPSLRTACWAGATPAPAAPPGATASSPSSPACPCSASRWAWPR